MAVPSGHHQAIFSKKIFVKFKGESGIFAVRTCFACTQNFGITVKFVFTQFFPLDLTFFYTFSLLYLKDYSLINSRGA
jgi:hypothetical protein